MLIIHVYYRRLDEFRIKQQVDCILPIFIKSSSQGFPTRFTSNGLELVEMTGTPQLAQLPIDPGLATLCDAGRIEE